MVHRSLDVLFENLGRLVAVLIGIPILLAAAALLIDRSQLVAARVWADNPIFVVDTSPLNQTDVQKPALSEAALLQELIGTDAFLNEVLTSTDSGFQRRDPAQQRADEQRVRQRLAVTTEGDHVFTVTYRADTATQGIALLNSLISGFSKSIETLELRGTAVQTTTTSAQISAAKTALEQSSLRLRAYRNSVPDQSLAALQQDPTYVTLAQEVTIRTNQYLALLAVSQQSQLQTSAIPQLQQAFFHVMDAPATSPRGTGSTSGVLRLLEYGLAGTAALELALVYAIARRDPRIRTGLDVQQRIAIGYLGSTPQITELSA